MCLVYLETDESKATTKMPKRSHSSELRVPVTVLLLVNVVGKQNSDLKGPEPYKVPQAASRMAMVQVTVELQSPRIDVGLLICY